LTVVAGTSVVFDVTNLMQRHAGIHIFAIQRFVALTGPIFGKFLAMADNKDVKQRGVGTAAHGGRAVQQQQLQCRRLMLRTTVVEDFICRYRGELLTLIVATTVHTKRVREKRVGFVIISPQMNEALIGIFHFRASAMSGRRLREGNESLDSTISTILLSISTPDLALLLIRGIQPRCFFGLFLRSKYVPYTLRMQREVYGQYGAHISNGP
jgi:hypothetical protein